MRGLIAAPHKVRCQSGCRRFHYFAGALVDGDPGVPSGALPLYSNPAAAQATMKTATAAPKTTE